jgi:hypothetical protein
MIASKTMGLKRAWIGRRLNRFREWVGSTRTGSAKKTHVFFFFLPFFKTFSSIVTKASSS